MRKSLYAMLLLALVLAACGQGGTGGPAVTSAPPAATTAPADATEAPADATEAPAAATTAPATGGGSDDDCANSEVFCVGLVTDVGRVDDKSFNQSAYEGAKQAETELGAVVNFIETTNANDYGNNILLFAEKDYDVIVTVGFALGQATNEAAAEYPEIKFIGVDQIQAEEIENVAGLIFHEDRAGYLAGALAASMSKSGTIAAVLGTDLVPPVVAFKEGYEAGARAVKQDINIISTYHLVAWRSHSPTRNGARQQLNRQLTRARMWFSARAAAPVTAR